MPKQYKSEERRHKAGSAQPEEDDAQYPNARVDQIENHVQNPQQHARLATREWMNSMESRERTPNKNAENMQWTRRTNTHLKSTGSERHRLKLGERWGAKTKRMATKRAATKQTRAETGEAGIWN